MRKDKVKTNHIQSGVAYCFLKDMYVPIISSNHIQRVCIKESCPYFNGSAQGDGVECLWYDGTNSPIDDSNDRHGIRALGKKRHGQKAD